MKMMEIHLRDDENDGQPLTKNATASGAPPPGPPRKGGCSCALTWSMHLIIVVNNAMSQAHGFVSLIIVTLIIIIIIINNHVAVMLCNCYY